VSAQLAVIEPQSASPAQLRDFAIAVRPQIPDLTAAQLSDLEAVLVAVAKRLRQIGQDATEAERTRIIAMQRYGELLGPPKPGAPQGNSNASKTTSENQDIVLSKAERDRRAQARLLAEQKAAADAAAARQKTSLNQAIKEARHARQEQQASETAAGTAVITMANSADWLTDQDPCDLLITDPPYSTDVEDIYSFADGWLPEALKRVKATGRAYVCIGAYPAELHAYLSVPCGELTLANVLVWTYRNTLGPTPSHDYKLNWQAILYYRGPEAPPLDSPRMTEQFTVQDINAPDGRQGDRLHAWQKPDELAERLIRHSTKPGDSILDPYAGTGTFLLAAARLGRNALGCDSDHDMVKLAVKRGCREC
jgi:16S rRNA G966 N2-methylase RsmD